jgi:ATP-dependent Clp protease ATP-binding subunit ClpC
MTSNVGTRQLKDFGKGVGFNTSTTVEADSEFSRGVIQKALNRTFAPEFLNRVDDVIMFDQLSKDSIASIIDLELKGIFGRVTAMGYKLELTKEAKDYIAEKGYDVQFGARPLKRAIQKYLEDELADVVLGGELEAGDTILMELEAETKVIKAKIVKPTIALN